MPEPEFEWVATNIKDDNVCIKQWYQENYPTELEHICAKYKIPASTTLRNQELRHSHINTKLKQIASLNKNILVFDTKPYICGAEACSTHDSMGVRIYKDDDHINTLGMEQLEPHFRKFLKSSGKVIGSKTVLEKFNYINASK